MTSDIVLTAIFGCSDLLPMTFAIFHKINLDFHLPLNAKKSYSTIGLLSMFWYQFCH